MEPSEIAVVVLDRDRNAELIAGLREAGAKVNLITDGDVAPALAAARADAAGRPDDGNRRHAGGRHLGGGGEVPGRRDPGEALAAERRGARQRWSTPATTSTAC